MKISSKALRLIQTTNLMVAVFCLGLTCSSFGATLLDLAEVYDTSSENISLSMTSGTVGSILGGLIGKLVFRSINTQIVIALCSFASGISVILTPVLKQLVYLSVTTFVCGLTMSFIEIGAHVWLQVLWKERTGPILQLYNLIFGVGGIVSPLICEPFLSRLVQGSQKATATLDSVVTTDTNLLSGSNSESNSRISVAYAILGSVFLFNAVAILCSYFIDDTNPVPDKSSTCDAVELPKKSRALIITMTTTYVFLGVMSEIALSRYLSTFVLRTPTLDFTKSSAAYLTSVFWSSYTLSRVITTGFSFVSSVSKLILFSQAVLIVATVYTVFFIQNSTFVAWSGTALLGFGLAPCFGNGTAWAVQYITLTHKHMSIIMVSVCLGGVLPAVIIGKYIETIPMVLMYGQIAASILLSICAAFILAYGRSSRLQEYRRNRTKSKMLHDEQTQRLDELAVNK